MRTDNTYTVSYRPSAAAAGTIEAVVIAEDQDTPENVLLAEFPLAVIEECSLLNQFVISR